MTTATRPAQRIRTGTGSHGRREESRDDVRAEGRDARRQQKLNAKAAKARKRRERAAEKAGKKKGMKRLLPTEDYPGTLVLRADKCTQDALGYELLCEDGTIKLQQGVYSRVVEFQDASFQAARESEQREIYENWSELLNTFDNTVHLQVKILCRVIDRDAFREDAFLPPVEGDYAGNRFRRDINQIIESKVAETQQNVERRRLFIVTVEAPTREQASPLLARATEQVMRSLKNMGVNSEEVRGNELLRIIDSITNPHDPRGFVSFDDLKVADEHGASAIQLGYTTKDLVAPADLTKIDDTHISWNGFVGPGALPPEVGGLGPLRHGLEPGGAAHQPGDHARHDELGAVARHRDHRVDEHRPEGPEVRLRAQALPDHVHHR